MDAWTGCEERELPALFPLGGCNASTACRFAFDGNASTWSADPVLKTERWLFGAHQGEEAGDTDGVFVGVDLRGERAYLLNITITPRPPGPGAWSPRAHPYNPPRDDALDWAGGLVGARVQGLDELGEWVDLHQVLAPPRPVLRVPWPDMAEAVCAPYRAFRLWVPHNFTRTFFVNTAEGPVETTETVSFASLAEVAFAGVRSRGALVNTTCLAEHPNFRPTVEPLPNSFPHFINVTWASPLAKCAGAVLALAAGAAAPSAASPTAAFGSTVDLAPDGVLGTESSAVTSAAVLYGGSLSLPATGEYTFPDAALAAVCDPGWAARDAWCYRWFGIEEARPFAEAEAHCVAQGGGHLASVWSPADNSFVRALKPAGVSGAASIAWLGLNVSDGGARVRWTDGSRVTFTNWLPGAPLHPNRSCAMLGAGDWYLSECSEAQGKGCASRVWGEWRGLWGDVVGLPWRSESQSCYDNQQDPVAPARGECWRPASEGTATDDPCRQPLPFVCKRRGPLVCVPGYAAADAAGALPCTRCTAGSFSAAANATTCTACPAGTSSNADNTGCDVTIAVAPDAPFQDGCGWCRLVTAERDVTPVEPAQAVSNATNATNTTDTTNATDTIGTVGSVGTGDAATEFVPYSTCNASLANASTGRNFTETVRISRAEQGLPDQLLERRWEEHAQVCCGVAALGLPACGSLLAAAQVAESGSFRAAHVARTVAVAPGYYTPSAEAWFNLSVTIECPACSGRSVPPHLADVLIVTRCLHGGANDYHTFPPPERPDPRNVSAGSADPPAELYNPTERVPPAAPLATGRDNCDPQTLAAEALACPAGYTLLPLDLNPGPSEARLCLRLSQRAERISDLAFVQTNQSEGRNHTCPAGFELVGEAGGPAAGLGDVTGAVDLWDGVGGNARVFLCARREGGLLRANLTSAAPGGCGGVAGEAVSVPGAGADLCLPRTGAEAALFDARGGPRVLAFGCASCRSFVRNISIASARVEPLPGGAGGAVGDMCGGADAGGGIHVRGGGVYEMEDVSVLNCSAKCGGGILLGGNASARLTNCTLLDNAARAAADGAGGVGAGLLAYSPDEHVALGQQWAAGSWGQPPSREAMHTETAGPMTPDPNRNALDPNWEFGALDMEGGVSLWMRDSWVAYNEARVPGGAPAGGGLGGMGGVGGGLALAHGRAWLASTLLEENGADAGASLAAVGDAGATECHGDAPQLPLARAAHCAHSVSRTRTSLRVQGAEVRREALRRPHASQELGSGAAAPCETYLTPHCWALRTRFSPWGSTPRVGPEPRAPAPGDVFLQHVTALVENVTYRDAEAETALARCAVAHSACLLPMEGRAGGEAARQCIAHGVLRLPCCQATVECEE